MFLIREIILKEFHCTVTYLYSTSFSLSGLCADFNSEKLLMWRVKHSGLVVGVVGLSV